MVKISEACNAALKLIRKRTMFCVDGRLERERGGREGLDTSEGEVTKKNNYSFLTLSNKNNTPANIYYFPLAWGAMLNMNKSMVGMSYVINLYQQRKIN